MEVAVNGEIAVPADELWRRVSDFGDVSWMKGVTRVEVEGRGAGMVRALWLGESPIREQLEFCDEAARRLGYTITQGNPLPVKDYHATMSVVDAGPGRSRLEWSARFEPSEVDAAEAATAVRGTYGVLIGWLRAAAEEA